MRRSPEEEDEEPEAACHRCKEGCREGRSPITRLHAVEGAMVLIQLLLPTSGVGRR